MAEALSRTSTVGAVARGAMPSPTLRPLVLPGPRIDVGHPPPSVGGPDHALSAPKRPPNRRR
ncbi:MAG: hypothetical protein L0H93_16885, partial [Nocardioides sp.]|nr:hypothetical protein [Nocardioides sp.]